MATPTARHTRLTRAALPGVVTAALCALAPCDPPRAHGQPSPHTTEAILHLILQSIDRTPTDPCGATTDLIRARDLAHTSRDLRVEAIAEAERIRAEQLCALEDPSDLPRTQTATDGAILFLVPSGRFRRGSSRAGLRRGLNTCRVTYSRPEDCAQSWFDRETPQRRIDLGSFYIDRHEVTNARYALCVKAGACQPIDRDTCNLYDPSSSSWELGGDGYPTLDAPDHPVVCATWSEAATFCQWAGGRLPTEAQWEKAARGDRDDREFPWGNDWQPASLNWGETGGFGSKDGFETTAPVGYFPINKSPYGSYDMAGNVWEWTADWHEATYYRHSPAQDPINKTETGQRAVRGGSWSFAGNGARVGYRYYEDPDTRDDSIGFRCAGDP